MSTLKPSRRGKLCSRYRVVACLPRKSAHAWAPSDASATKSPNQARRVTVKAACRGSRPSACSSAGLGLNRSRCVNHHAAALSLFQPSALAQERRPSRRMRAEAGRSCGFLARQSRIRVSKSAAVAARRRTEGGSGGEWRWWAQTSTIEVPLKTWVPVRSQ